jgi:hypothetical protein
MSSPGSSTWARPIPKTPAQSEEDLKFERSFSYPSTPESRHPPRKVLEKSYQLDRRNLLELRERRERRREEDSSGESFSLGGYRPRDDSTSPDQSVEGHGEKIMGDKPGREKFYKLYSSDNAIFIQSRGSQERVKREDVVRMASGRVSTNPLPTQGLFLPSSLPPFFPSSLLLSV